MGSAGFSNSGSGAAKVLAFSRRLRAGLIVLFLEIIMSLAIYPEVCFCLLSTRFSTRFSLGFVGGEHFCWDVFPAPRSCVRQVFTTVVLPTVAVGLSTALEIAPSVPYFKHEEGPGDIIVRDLRGRYTPGYLACI